MNRFANRRGGRCPAHLPPQSPEKKPIQIDRFCFKEDYTFPARHRYQGRKANRSCFVAPETHDFSSETLFVNNQCDEMFHALFGQKASVPERRTQVKEPKSIVCNSRAKAEAQSQCVVINSVSVCVDTSDNICQMLDSNDQVELVFHGEIGQEQSNTKPPTNNIIISEIPRVKVIAEQFYKFKKNDIELRKLDEKIVCVEYDVFDEDNMDKPRQTMRAYFSIKPRHNDLDDDTKDQLEHIKKKLELPEEYLNQPTNNEIEIIDSQITQNQSYLDDIKLVLRRHKAIEQQKKKSTLDLKSLYEIAKNRPPILQSGMSKKQLQKAKEMILQGCKSSIHGMTRRRVKSPSVRKRKYEPSEVTKSIMNDLLS